jgi:exodeoxyribonuclease V alpha subunit
MTALPLGDFEATGEDPVSSSVVRSLAPENLLRQFNRAGVLAPADVHVARTLARLVGETDDVAVLGAAFAVRAPRVGHVFVDLDRVRGGVSAGEEAETDLETLPWPDPELWRAALAVSPLVTCDPRADPGHPLVLEGAALYLDRMWRDELNVAEAIGRRAAFQVDSPGTDAVDSLVDRVVPGGSEAQRRAIATIIGRRLAVVAGGPGTGKTTTVARALAAIFVDAEERGVRAPLVALAAPTGKAAARLAEAVRAEAAALDLPPSVRLPMEMLESFTVHRLLRRVPGSDTRFRHHRDNPLVHDVIVVDETSMLPLWLMARLVGAVRDEARLVLVGDPEQLASVEAGVVLADVVGPMAHGVDSIRAEAGGSSDGPPATPPATPPAIAACVVGLSFNYRFTGVLAELAEAVRAGAADRAVDILAGGGPELEWLDRPGTAASAGEAALLDMALVHARGLVEVARGGDVDEALQAVGRFRLLCAHRRGTVGALHWNERVERQVRADPALGGGSAFYVGRPVIVTANDYGLGLFNGDVGIVVPRDDGGLRVVFRRGSEVVSVSPMALPAFSGVYALTIHRAQGSEFDDVAIVLPEPSSRVLTRELLYTALTRARCSVRIVGSEEALRAAIERRVARASGLMARLWGTGYRS